MVIVSAPLLLVEDVLIGPGAVVVEDGRITAVLDHVPAPGAGHTELTSGILTAGLVDLQLNGFAGHDLAGTDYDGWNTVRRALPRTGVTSFVATYITAPVGELFEPLERAEKVRSRHLVDGARLLGVHLEGPFLSPARKGAHDAGAMTDPEPALLAALTQFPALTLMTLAPERTGATAAIGVLREGGVVVSLGHSDATSSQATAGVAAGARMVTHVFNAMRAMHHREPGLAGVALTDPRLTVGLICDLHHVAPLMCALVFAAAAGRVALVTDAVAAAGMPPGSYELGGEVLHVAEPGALPRRADGTIAGSSLTLDLAVRNAVTCGLDAGAALTSASAVPARLLGRTDVGVLAEGAHGDLVWWSDDLYPQRTWLAGTAVT